MQKICIVHIYLHHLLHNPTKTLCNKCKASSFILCNLSSILPLSSNSDLHSLAIKTKIKSGKL